jgi:hypothetical protein
MRRLLLSGAMVSSVALIGLTCAMSSRSNQRMDWVRIRAFDRAAVFACSRSHLGAAVVTDDAGWFAGNERTVRYRDFRPTDLRRHFGTDFHGFAYRDDRGVHLVLVPMWSLPVLGTLPGALWLMQRRAPRRNAEHARRLHAEAIDDDFTAAPSIS